MAFLFSLFAEYIELQVLVAGGAGFIGSRLAIALANTLGENQVVVLDNLTRRGSELNLNSLTASGVHFVHGDIRCLEDLGDAKLQAETIIDCSAEPSVLAGYSASQRMVQNNLVGTINLLEKAKEWRSRFVFLSTSRVYPIEPLCRLPIHEHDDRLAFDEKATGLIGVSSEGLSENFPLQGYRSLYGATKLAGELMVEEYRQAFGLKTVINRFGVITGPGQMARSDQGVFALWMAAHVLKRPLKYIGFGGSGKQVRDLLHVDDLVDLVQLQLKRFEEIDGETFNAGGGATRALSLLQTTKLCEEISGNRIHFDSILENRPGDIPWFVTDARKLESTLGWKPRLSARETLESIFRWIVADEQTLARVLG